MTKRLKEFATLLLGLLVGFAPIIYSQSLTRTTNVAGGPNGTGTFVGDFDSGMVTVPNALTTASTSQILVSSIYCHNITGVAATITIQDQTGVVYVPTSSIAGNAVTQFLNSGSKGIQMNGFKWQAGTANAINCQITGWN